jgi:hypothetical protein
MVFNINEMNEIITNGSEIKLRILEEINNSRKNIFLAMAFFTDRDIANAIILAKKRNVAVDIILSSNAQNENVKQMFKDEYISVHAFETGDERGMMHHKFCLIDNNVTINGSYNYSYNASNNNVENIHISDDYSIYKQFLNEFEKLKYNIDNNISVNDNSTIKHKMEKPEINTSINQIDSFSQQLYNIVYLSAQIDVEEYKRLGYEKSKENNGSVEIFKSEFSNLKEQIRLYKLDDSLNNKKSNLISNIQTAYENKKDDIEREKQNELNVIKNDFELEKRQIKENIEKVKGEKLILETGNQITNEKGIFQINKELEKNKLEIKTLDESFLITKFWNLGTILSVIFLSICFFYLSIFFSSALYKVFFEFNILEAAADAGMKIQKPQIIDANAIINIFNSQGTLFGILAMLIFLFPLALTNLSILGNKDPRVNKISFWIGLVVFDIIVSAMVAINTDKINSNIQGLTSTMQFWEVIKLGEFYLIFVFGMLPLFITHNLINLISKSYKKSKKELLDEEKSRKLQILIKEGIELNYEKENIVNQIKVIDEKIKNIEETLSLLENNLNNKTNQLDLKYSNLSKQAKEIFDDYNTRVLSGKIFTDIILNSIISSFKTGFIDFLPEFYADQEVSNRVREIENEIAKNN